MLTSSDKRTPPSSGKAEIAQAESDVQVFRTEFGQEPGCAVPRAEKFHERLNVLGLSALVRRGRH